MNQSITERYGKETATASLGCANLAPFFAITSEDSVLDLGCGSGGQSARIHTEYHPKQIIGLDLTPAMIDKARERYPQLEFVVGDILQLPFPDETFDVITSNCVINHASDKRKVFSEIYRVLKPDGHFLIGDVMAVDRLPEEVANDPEAIAACYGGAIPKEEYLEEIRKLGFTHIEQLASRTYPKEGYWLESIILQGFKP